MIPVTLPIILMVFIFLILVGISLLFLGGSGYVMGLLRSKTPLKASLEADGEPAVSRGSFAVGTVAASSAGTPSAGAMIPRVEGYSLPQMLYYHAGHTWAALKETGEVLVGIDDFAAKLLGAAKIIASPRVGQRLQQGEQGWILRRKGKDLRLPIPVDGEVKAVNERVFGDPSLLSSQPYGGGWLILMKPANVRENLRHLFQAGAAREWLERCAAEVRTAFTGKLGLVYQDGGLPEDGLADFLSLAEWDDLMMRLSQVRSDVTGE